MHYYISTPFHGDQLRYNDAWMQCYFWLNKVWNPDTMQTEKYKWKPKDGEYCFTITTPLGHIEIARYVWNDDLLDTNIYKVGNCFKTKEEAEAKLEKIKKLFLEV